MKTHRKPLFDEKYFLKKRLSLLRNMTKDQTGGKPGVQQTTEQSINVL